MSNSIFDPQVSVVAHGLEGKTIMIYGSNSTGKTAQCVRMRKPFFLMCENGLGAQVGVRHLMITNWRQFTKAIKELTDPKTIDQAKELYSTIVIDEVYASSLFCQKFVCDTYGDGCISLGANENSKVNLYQIYERVYWEQIQKLVTAGYTVVFIAHVDYKDEQVRPKGDKRCINPIIDNCDVIAFLKSQGVDEDGKVIKSKAYFAETAEHFARTRYDYMVTEIPEFTAEALEKAIADGIEAQEKAEGVASVSYEEQQSMYQETNTLSFEELQGQIQVLGSKLAASGYMEELTDIVEKTLGVGKKVSACTKKQTEAMSIILEDIKEKCAELGIK